MMKGNSVKFTRPPGRRAWLVWSIRPTKSLTYTPMRAWANKAGEMYAYPGRNQASVDHIELFKVMLKTEIDIVDFAPGIGSED